MKNQLLGGLRIVFIVHIVVGIIFGLGFFLIPVAFGKLYNWPLTDPYFPRMIGAAILGYTASSWFALHANAWDKVKIVVQIEMAWTILNTLAQIWGMVTEELPAAGWLNVVLMAAFAVAFSYYYFQEERAIAIQPKPVTLQGNRNAPLVFPGILCHN